MLLCRLGEPSQPDYFSLASAYAAKLSYLEAELSE